MPVTYEGLNTKDTLHHIQAFVACSKGMGLAHADAICCMLIVAHLAKEILVKSCLHGIQLFAGEVRAGHGHSDQSQEDRIVVFLSFIGVERGAKEKSGLLIDFSSEHLKLFGLITA